MKKMRWVLLVAAAVAGIIVGILGSCAIDDEITWINDERCTNGCLAGTAEDYACDTDDSCTSSGDCVDWDCDDDNGPPPVEDAGIDTSREVSDGAVIEDVVYGDETDPSDGGEDDTDDSGGWACVPDGGGESRDAPFELTLGEELADLTACAVPSRWFRFTVAAGVRFEVDLVPAPERQVEFLLYAEDGSVVAAADMAAEADYNAAAETGGAYLLRVRAVGDGPVGYSLAVRELP